MNALRRSLTAGRLGLAVILGACGGDSAADDPEVAEAVEALDDVMTQEEADAAAADAITEDNADAEFEKLMQEIESDN
ncbi:MAG: hypothetical protein ACYTCU_05820 [Planctomycetota bacterium]|jgi:hypothetical protein